MEDPASLFSGRRRSAVRKPQGSEAVPLESKDRRTEEEKKEVSREDGTPKSPFQVDSAREGKVK